MSENHLSQENHASQNRLLVTALQEERSEVWSLYCKIAEMKPSFANSEKVRPVLSQFLQLLIDYISLGHFGVYEHLLTEKQQQLALDYANRIYPTFSNTTATAVSFSDAYGEGKRNFNTDRLAADLSVLGEELAKRMELEDRLCSMLLH